jgi:hypothetical protein
VEVVYEEGREVEGLGRAYLHEVGSQEEEVPLGVAGLRNEAMFASASVQLEYVRNEYWISSVVVTPSLKMNLASWLLPTHI